MEGVFAGGSMWVALATAAVLAGGLVAERALLTYRWTPYFSAGFALMPPLIDIASPPEDGSEGSTASVAWEHSETGIVRYWAPPGERRAPMGLRGTVRFRQHRGAIAVDVRWAPPWTPGMAATWFAVLGAVRGEAQLTLPVGAILILIWLYLYHQAARRAAAELRWAFIRGDGDHGATT